MKNLNKKLISALFKSSNGLYVFTLYKRFNASPKELFLTIKDLLELNYITEDDGRLTLTSNGKTFVIENNISISVKENKFSKIPEHFLGQKIEVNEFYLPKYAEIKNELLNSQIKQ